MSEETNEVQTEEVVSQDAATETQVETTEITSTEEAPKWFAEFGLSSEDEAVEYTRSLHARKNDLDSRTSSINEREALLSSIEEDPYIDENVAKIVQYTKAGLKDVSLISKIDAITEESASSNPFETMALAKSLSDPKWVSKIGGLGRAAEYFESMYPDYREGEPNIKVSGDLINSLRDIEKFKESLPKLQNPVNFAKEKLNKVNTETQQLLSETGNRLVNLFAGWKDNFNVTDADKVVSIPISKEEKAMIAESLTGLSKDNLLQLSSADGKAMEGFVRNQLILSKYHSGQLFAERDKQILNEQKKEIVKGVANGSPKPISRTGQPPAEAPIKKLSERIASGIGD